MRRFIMPAPEPSNQCSQHQYPFASNSNSQTHALKADQLPRGDFGCLQKDALERLRNNTHHTLSPAPSWVGVAACHRLPGQRSWGRFQRLLRGFRGFLRCLSFETSCSLSPEVAFHEPNPSSPQSLQQACGLYCDASSRMALSC